jgi:hypothetical protein
MKKKLLIGALGFIFLAGAHAFACDPQLKRFARDCSIQDRLTKLRVDLQAKNVDVNEISEYRVLRFIDRGSWEKAKQNKTAPKDIYNPVPITWNVWDEGIRKIFASPNFKGILYRGLKLDSPTISNINKVLLTNGKDNIKDPRSDQKKQPGEFRQATDLQVGFCNPMPDSTGVIDKSRQSVQRFQQKWEQNVGSTFQQLVRQSNGLEPDSATMVANIFDDRRYNCGVGNTWVSYAPSEDVAKQLSWIEIFIKKNLDLYFANKAVLPPVAMAAFVQKWFVTIHPFSDGNGRTSRGVEDILLANFSLPYAPAGDLQNDALAEFEPYLELTYNRIEAMLSVLESCSANINYANPRSGRTFQCDTVANLNK